MSSSFLTPIQHREGNNLPFKDYLSDVVEDYFYLGGSPVYVITGSVIPNGSQEIELRDQGTTQNVILIALKVLSYMTLIMPLIVLAAKVVYRGTHSFHITPGAGANTVPALSINITPTQETNTNLPPTDTLHPQTITQITIIPQNFTINESIETQREAHERAKRYLQEQAQGLNADFSVVSPDSVSVPSIDDVTIGDPLDPNTFCWENTAGVQGDIQRDGKLEGSLVLYGVASQFNTCESPNRYTPRPGNAVQTYVSDPTQGPGAQLQFPAEQVEVINNAANLGFNGMCNVMNDSNKGSMRHGYLTPKNSEAADILINQLKTIGNKIEYLCAGNIPKGQDNTEKVYEILVAAPAFGGYSFGNATHDQKKEIAFLCALHSYRAQFKQAIALANQYPDEDVIFKPTAPGLGVFGNDVTSVAKAFYTAGKEYENSLREKNISVRFQVFRGGGQARTLVNNVGLNQLI